MRKKVKFDGHEFDSEKEAKRYGELMSMQRTGLISNLQCQVPYTLMDGYIENGKIIGQITYIADFTYTDEFSKKTIIENTKGYRTEVYKFKKKMLEAIYPELEIKEL